MIIQIIHKKILFLIVLLIAYIHAFSQVNADFITNDSAGCNSLVVSFTNLSSGTGVLEYSWDFGNGSTSIIENPQTAYTNPGLYNVSLIVSNETDSDTLLKENYISIYDDPEASFISLDETSGCSPLDIEFQNNSTVGDAPIINTVWDFGDFSYSDSVNPIHTYIEPNNYDVSLFISDTNGCNHSIFVENYIEVYDKPTIDFIGDNSNSCFDTLTVTFENSSTGNGTLEYHWDFGDGNTSTDMNPVHFYEGFDLYTVVLQVTDQNGCVDSMVRSEYIKLQFLEVDMNVIDEWTCRNQNLDISNNTIGANIHGWTFGDGTTSNLFLPEKAYTDTGSFIIQYVASLDNVCTDTIIDSIYVDPIMADFTADQSYICELPADVEYIDQSINAISWEWLFGNGNTSIEQQPIITYSLFPEIQEDNQEIYSDTLIVVSEFGCTDTLIVDTSVTIIIPKVYFTPNDSTQYDAIISGCLPVIIDFIDESINYNEDDEFVTWQWSFGDGNTSDEQNPDYTYNEHGDYEVVLNVINSSGCENTYDALVEVGFQQTADFIYTGDPIICASEEATFENISTVDTLIDDLFWLFGDGQQSYINNPSNYFLDTGYMATSLTVYYNGCTSETLFRDSVVKILGPAGTFNVSSECEDPLNYNFHSFVKGLDSLIWNFDDGFYDSTNSIITNHIYTVSDNFNPSIYAKNETTNCELEVSLPIFVRNLQGSFIFSPENNCVGDTISFDASSSIDIGGFFHNGNFGKYLWNFGDTEYDTITSVNINHDFQESGEYIISLIVKDINNCSDIITDTIIAYKPEANFNVINNAGCLPLSVDFIDVSTSDTTIASWNWNLGNGAYSTDTNFTYLYDDIGKYTISLITTDIFGCKDTVTQDSSIIVSKPQPSFSVLDDEICLGDSIFIENTSDGNDIKAVWDFGDGNQSLDFDAAHVYQDTGYFDITLSLTDEYGCDSALNRTNAAYVQAIPIAYFSSDFTTTGCYPSLISFFDESISGDLVFWEWDLDYNGFISNEQNPRFNYQVPGLYDIQLLVSTSIGCSDTLIKEEYLNIGGPYAEIIITDSACININVPISLIDTVNVYSLQWTLSDGSVSDQDSVNEIFETFGTHNIFLLLSSDSLNTCTKIVSDSVHIPTLIADYSLNDSVGCVPLEVNFFNASVGSLSQSWNFGNDSTSSELDGYFYYETPGNYNVKLLVENSIECEDSIFKVLIVNPLPSIQTSNDTLICSGDSIELFATGGISYEWIENEYISDASVYNPRVFPESEMNYFVAVTDSNNCIKYDSVRINVQQKPEALISNEDIVDLIVGEEVELMAEKQMAYSYFWSPDLYLSCVNCYSTYSRPFESTMYYFHAIDENDCFDIIDSVLVNVEHKYSLDIPTAFTPNNDGKNDVIYVRGWGIKELVEFNIFDQFGKLVFTTIDIEQSWDGTMNLMNLNQGTYFYVVKVLSYDDEIRSKSGSIYLIR